MNPTLLPFLVGGLIIVAGFLVALVVLDIGGRKAEKTEAAEPSAPPAPVPQPARPRQLAKEGMSGMVKGAVLIVLLVVGLGVYQGWKEDKEKEKEKEKVEREVQQKKLAVLNQAYDEMVAAKRNRPPEREGEPEGGSLTLRNFNQLESGVSYAGACIILGKRGTLTSSSSFEGVPTAEMYTWQEGSRVVTCMFQGDKLVTKAQHGLR